MKRHFYISNDFDDLVTLERELGNAGVEQPQFHVLSNNDAGVDNHNLHAVEAVLKSDVVYKTELGFCVGIVVAAIILTFANYSGIAESYTWVPFIFLSIVLLGFCTWEGGFIGTQEIHHDFARFKETLDAGNHIFFVDVTAAQEDALQAIVSRHPNMTAAGEGASTPKVAIDAQRVFNRFMRSAP